MPRNKLVDNTGRFIVPIVYRLRTADGEPFDAGQPAAPVEPAPAPTCDHCGAPLALHPEADTITANGTFTHTVKRDTREQAPYEFSDIGWDAQDGGGPGKTITIETIRGTLRSGDYSLLGYESRVAIERKSLEDLYSTIAQGRDRFERELQRLTAFEFAAVVIEADWPTICGSPPSHTKLAPKTVLRSVITWMQRFPTVHWVPAGSRRLAEVMTFRMLERFLKEELQRGQHKQGEGEREGEREQAAGGSGRSADARPARKRKAS